jgi:hypothetical protein
MKLALGALLVAAALVAFFMLLPAARLHAQIMTPFQVGPQSFTFGMAGMAAGQAARLNALQLPEGGPLVAGSCQVTFTFYDDQGTSLAAKTLPLTQNQAAHLDYVPAQVAASNPVEIRGTVQTAFTMAPGATSAVPVSCSVVPTMEIYDTSNGQTTLLLENAHALPLFVALKN